MRDVTPRATGKVPARDDPEFSFGVASASSRAHHPGPIIRMKANIARLVVAAALMASALSLTACNTMRGLGQDVEKAGEGIQKAANK